MINYYGEWTNIREIQVSKRTLDRVTNCERISFESVSTWANRAMIIHATFSIGAANVRARIHTFLVDTRLIKRTFWWYYTLWPTSRSASNESRQTRTDCNSIIVSALTIRTTRTWTTSIDWLVILYCCIQANWYQLFRCKHQRHYDFVETYVFLESKNSIDTSHRYNLVYKHNSASDWSLDILRFVHRFRDTDQYIYF